MSQQAQSAPPNQAGPAPATAVARPPVQAVDDAVPIDLEAFDAAADVPSPKTVPYDLEKKREDVRGRVVGGLLLLLAIVVLWPLGSIAFGRSFAEYKDYLTLVLTSLIGLVGTALGFYYGGKSK